VPGALCTGLGEAVDLGSVDGKFGKTAAGQWLHANAAKFGLYFPMNHEDWHIEMTGGTRQTKLGNPNHRPFYQSDSDSPVDSGSIIQQVAQRIAGHESGGDPNAQSTKSSAGGLGSLQTLHGSTLFERWTRRSRACAGDILALKKGDPAFQMKVLDSWTANNAKKLQANGIEANPGNLYAAHFLGRNLAPKVLKASDNAGMSQFMDDDCTEG
jgi:hypothetical protein